MEFVIYQNRLYMFEATATQTQQLMAPNTQAHNNLQINLNDLRPVDEKTFDEKKDSLKLTGAKLNSMDLWTPLITYFDKYNYSSNSATAISLIKDKQSRVVGNIEKFANEIAIEYRNIANSHISNTSYRTNDDNQYRKVLAVYRHYFYFVALYNLKFVDYLNSKVKSGELFQKSFIDDLSNMYDPPSLSYIETQYLNPSSTSAFNSDMDSDEWNNEIEDIVEKLATGFAKSTAWDFNRLAGIYVKGFVIETKTPTGKQIHHVGVRFNKTKEADAVAIESMLNEITYATKNVLSELKPNVIKSSIKDLSNISPETGFAKDAIKDKTRKIGDPYQTLGDYNSNIAHFRQDDVEKNKKNMADITKFNKKGVIGKTAKAVANVASKIPAPKAPNLRQKIL